MFCLALVMSLFSLAMAFGRRGNQPAQLTYQLVAEGPLPGALSVVHFSGDKPAMLAAQKSVQFLASSGQVLSRLERGQNTRVFLSKKGNFVGVQELADLDQKLESPRTLTFTLYDGQGKKRWSLSRPLGVDTPMPSFYLSNLGTLVMVEPLEGILSFYDQAGSLVQEASLFPKTSAEMERSVACAFSENGTYFIVNALKHHARPGSELSPREKGHSYLILFDGLGTEIWRRELAHEVSLGVEISPGGEAIVAGGYSVKGLDTVERATYLYGLEGNLQHTYEFPFRYADFSSDGGFLLLGQKNSLHLVETQTGQVLWEHLLPGKAGQIRALDLSWDGHLALVELAPGRYRGPQFVYQSPQISLFDQEGHQIWEKKFPEERFLQPLAKFLDESSRFLLAFEKRYLIYAQNQ
jgi:hypothetical protein